MEKGATFSEDRKYRYALWRIWDGEDGQVMFIGLNPSTADEMLDDPTVRRCIGFAKRWGYGGIYMMNLFAFRATDPKVLKAELDPFGNGNLQALKVYKRKSLLTIACWGNHGKHRGQSEYIRAELGSLWCFGLTKLGEPKHPLYLPADAKLDVC